MNTRFLAVGLACLSAVAMGQSDGNSGANKEKPKATDKPVTTVSGDPHEVVAPRDLASGQASGKRMHKPVTVTAEVGLQAPTTSKEVSKTSAADDWEAPAAKSSKPSVRTASATGVQDPTPAQATDKAHSRPIGSSGQDGVSAAREASSGMATGKKAADKSSDKANPADAPKK
jgi:hypothetical protein